MKFSEYQQRCLTMGLQLAQYVQSNEIDGSISFIKSDMSRAFIKFAGTDLLLADFFLFVHNSQELQRQVEAARQLAIQNNNTGANMLDLWTLVSSNSPKEIKTVLEQSVAKLQEQGQQQSQIADRQMAAAAEENEKERQHQILLEDMGNETELEKAYIQNFGFNKNNTMDADNNDVPDVLEYDKLNQKAEAAEQSARIQQATQRTNERIQNQKLKIERDKIRQKDREMKSKERLKKIDQSIARENKTNAELKRKSSTKK